MIDLYTWGTPNGRKPLILLEELGLPYTLHRVNIGHGAQRSPEYLRLNPNGKIPALVDEPGTEREVRVFESGAILIHLAEKAGRFLPASGQGRADTLAWLMFQMSAVGPMFGQLGQFKRRQEPVPAATEHFQKEAERICGVLDGRLAETSHLAGEYGIADMATYPWASNLDRLGIPRERYPHLARWLDAVGARPAVQRAMAVEFK